MKMRFTPANDMRAIVSMISTTLIDSGSPAKIEMAAMLKSACCEWIEKIEALESEHDALLSAAISTENGVQLTDKQKEKLDLVLYK